MRHPLEQAQVKQKEVLLMVVKAKMWFKKPEGNPQKKVSDQGLEAWWCLRPLKLCCSLNPPPLGLNLDLVTRENQASSAKCHKEQMMATLSVREAENNFCPPQEDWDLVRIIYHQHSRENFGEGGEEWRHEMFAVSLPNTTHLQKYI